MLCRDGRKNIPENWINNHSFLSPTITGGMESFGALRELKNHYFIEVTFFPYANGEIYQEEIYLTQKEYVKQEMVDGYQWIWQTKKYINIWDRKNKTAIELLTNIYGDSIAKDYINSIYVYAENEYVLCEGSSYYRYNIPNNFISLLKDKDYIKI